MEVDDRAPNFFWCVIHQRYEVGPDVHLQSGVETDMTDVVPENADVPEDGISEETVTFLDSKLGTVGGFKSVVTRPQRVGATIGVDLGEFLSRPVRINTFTWLETDPVGTIVTMNPWHLYFNDSRIKNKINNFPFLRCDLKIKVLINASPFYYGSMCVSYTPVPAFTPSTIVTDSSNYWLINNSQRPRFWIYPQNNAGGEMTLPFFWPRNWIDTQIASEFSDMGELRFINYTQLMSANGVTGSGITVQVFAWAENVELAGASVGLALQSGDEYGDMNGSVSGPASAVATAAGMMESVPVIGRFATATRIGAGALAKIASLFGFTNVPVVQDAHAFRSSPFPQFASPSIGYPTEKLTIDCKNELSIDPGAVGLPSIDEMSISYLVQKESYLCKADWTTTNVTDDILFTTVVTPKTYASTSDTNYVIQNTPMGWLSALFANWRGDIIYRFRFICSQYHRGRVRITYDPAGVTGNNIISDVTSSTVAFTQIVDLGKDTDIEIRVPYLQSLPWQRIHETFDFASTSMPWSLSATPTFAYDRSFNNGTLCVRVMNALSAPVGTSTIQMQVFVRGAENLEFANPQNPPQNLTRYTIQSGEETEYENPTVINAGTVTAPAPERYLVNFGENIKTLRQIMRRTNLIQVCTIPDVTLDYNMVTHTMSRFPLQYGYTTSGVDQAKGIVVPASTFQFNWTTVNPFTWLTPAYAGMRGSMMWHFNVNNTVELGSIKVYRAPETAKTLGYNIASAARAPTGSANNAWFLTQSSPGASGQALTTQKTQAGLSVSLPNYTNYRFQTTNPAGASSMPTGDGQAYDGVVLEIPVNGTTDNGTDYIQIWKYAGIGTDFGMYFFVNVPTFKYYSATPTPV